jgi:hypothetical protein
VSQLNSVGKLFIKHLGTYWCVIQGVDRRIARVWWWPKLVRWLTFCSSVLGGWVWVWWHLLISFTAGSHIPALRTRVVKPIALHTIRRNTNRPRIQGNILIYFYLPYILDFVKVKFYKIWPHICEKYWTSIIWHAYKIKYILYWF